MAKLTGIFEGLKGLGDLSAEDLIRWLGFNIEVHQLENFLANRLIYPQTVPMTIQELDIDFAILREAIRLNSGVFFDTVKKTVTIPEQYLARFPNLGKLIWSFIDALVLNEVVRIVLQGEYGKKTLGSILTFSSPSPTQIIIGGREYKLPKGSLTAIPLREKSIQAILDGRKIAVFGGEAGLYVDLRK